jgi:hypothetical protein
VTAPRKQGSGHLLGSRAALSALCIRWRQNPRKLPLLQGAAWSSWPIFRCTPFSDVMTLTSRSATAASSLKFHNRYRRCLGVSFHGPGILENVAAELTAGHASDTATERPQKSSPS